jgi:hypothetical protein
MVYQLHGMPRPFVTGRRIALKGPTTWRVVSDRGVAERLPWEVASFRVRTSPHVMLMSAPGVATTELLRGLERAHGEISRTLPGRPLPAAVLAIAVRTTREGSLLTRFFDRSLAAVDDATLLYGPPPARAVDQVLSQRVIVHAPSWQRLPARDRTPLLVHELAHVALDPDSSGRLPAWLMEGVAMHLAGDDRTFEGGLISSEGSTEVADLCRPAAIARRRGNDQYEGYAVASAAAEAIVRRHGRIGLLALHDAFADSAIPGGACRAADAVMRETLGMSLAELDRAVAGG